MNAQQLLQALEHVETIKDVSSWLAWEFKIDTIGTPEILEELGERSPAVLIGTIHFRFQTAHSKEIWTLCYVFHQNGQANVLINARPRSVMEHGHPAALRLVQWNGAKGRHAHEHFTTWLDGYMDILHRIDLYRQVVLASCNQLDTPLMVAMRTVRMVSEAPKPSVES